MKVLVNALPARDGGGITYLVEELRAIERLAPGVVLEVLAAPWSYEAIATGIHSQVRRIKVMHVGDRFLFEQTILRSLARSYDVLYCPLNFGPVLWGGESAVLTVHNANYFARGLTMEGTEASRPWIKVKACHAAIRECRTVVAISESLGAGVAETLPEHASKIRIVKSGAPNWEGVQSSAVDSLPERFIVTVGSEAPHKRLEEVVEGWSAAVRETGEDVGLVVVGGLSERIKHWHQDVAGVAAHLLVHLGRVTERGRLRWLYENALSCVSMSGLEAFPLTVGEAGSLGCPLVLSDIPPHREVSLGNAVFITPGSPMELASALPEAFKRAAGSCSWVWPVTWADHAEGMVELFEDICP